MASNGGIWVILRQRSLVQIGIMFRIHIEGRRACSYAVMIYDRTLVLEFRINGL